MVEAASVPCALDGDQLVLGGAQGSAGQEVEGGDVGAQGRTSAEEKDQLLQDSINRKVQEEEERRRHVRKAPRAPKSTSTAAEAAGSSSWPRVKDMRRAHEQAQAERLRQPHKKGAHLAAPRMPRSSAHKTSSSARAAPTIRTTQTAAVYDVRSCLTTPTPAMASLEEAGDTAACGGSAPKT